MQTLRTANAVYTLSPTRNVGELQAKLAKCNGKYKPTKIKADKRVYPLFGGDMSTEDYVLAYERANNGDLKHDGFFAELNSEPCTLYTGEDSFEIIADEAPAEIEAYELQGAELENALECFA